ncbi:MFS transporter [Macrococcus lamae]|nr:MFS transporter [Macrococcus lamae]
MNNSFKNKNFLLYMIGGSVSTAGTVLTDFGIIFLAYNMTKSGQLTSYIGAVETMPYIFFGLIGGVVADWYIKRHLLIVMQLIRIPLLVLLIVFYYLHQINLMSLIAIVILLSMTGCFFNPAHRALLPKIVIEEERVTANSYYDIAIRATTIVGMFISGIILLFADIGIFFIIDLVTYIISLICLLLLNVNETKTNISKSIKKVKDDLLEFYSYLKTQLIIKQLFSVTFLIVFLNTWIFDIGFLLLLKESSDHVQSDYAFYKGLYSIFGIVVNLFIPLLFKKQSIETYLIGTLVWGAGFLLMSVWHDPVGIIISLFIISAGLILSSMTRAYLIQSEVSEPMHARAFSFNAVLLYIANTISYIVFGFLYNYVSISIIYLACSLLMIITAVLFFELFRRQKRQLLKP